MSAEIKQARRGASITSVEYVGVLQGVDADGRTLHVFLAYFGAREPENARVIAHRHAMHLYQPAHPGLYVVHNHRTGIFVVRIWTGSAWAWPPHLSMLRTLPIKNEQDYYFYTLTEASARLLGTYSEAAL